MSNTYTIVGSSGELERYDDSFGDVTAIDAELAYNAEQEVVSRKNVIEKSFLEMAFLLDEFDRQRFYLGRGYTSMKEWSESPDVEIGNRVALDLIRIVREAIPAITNVHGGEKALSMVIDAKVSKTRAALPLLSENMTEEFVDLIERAPFMTFRDVNKEVKALRRGDDEDPADVAVFKAYVRAGQDINRYRIVVIEEDVVEDVGTLRIPTKYANRWNDRFGHFLELEIEN